MTDSEPPFDVSDALDAALKLVTSARADLVKTLNTYNMAGPKLIEITLERLEQLNDPPVSPARTEAAAGLTNELTSFDDLWVPLVSSAGMVLFDLDQALSGLIVLSMSIPSPRPIDTAGLDATAKLMEMALAYGDALKEAIERNKILGPSAAVAAEAVAETVQEAAGLLIARLNLLLAFIRRTDPAPKNTDVSLGWFVRNFTRSGINEIALKAAEEFLRAVPGVGIAMSVVSITRDVQEKKKALRERRELLERVAAAYFQPGVTDDMSILLGQFQHDNESIKGLFPVIDKLTKHLNSGLAG